MVSGKFRQDARNLFISFYRCQRQGIQHQPGINRLRVADSTAAPIGQSSRVP
jgi:hypothetical protein